MNRYETVDPWLSRNERLALADRQEKERLAHLKRIKTTKTTLKILYLFLLFLSIFAATYFLLVNAGHIKATVVQPGINYVASWWIHLCDAITTCFVSFDYWMHVRTLWSWLSEHLHLEKHGSVAGAFFDVADIVYSYGLIVPFFLVFWMVGRLFDRNMTALDAALCLGKWILIIAIFAALLYGAIIFIALAALAVCGPLVAGGVARPAVSHRMRW
jgi:hypothetical protein